MMNNLMNMLGIGNIMGGNGGMNGIANIIQQFQQFRNSYRGDARQEIQNMLNSGQLTQAQYNQAVQVARQLQSLIQGK